jgi:hypothetical protein
MCWLWHAGIECAQNMGMLERGGGALSGRFGTGLQPNSGTLERTKIGQ